MHSIEPNTHGPVKTFKYGGLPAIQVWGVDKAFTKLAQYVQSRPFDVIIELGADYGGLTNMLADNPISSHATIHTFDLNRDRFTNLWPEKIVFHCMDIYANFEYISKLFDENRRVLVLCDGGNKALEYKELSRWLNYGDIIMAHDYYPDKAEFEAGKLEGRWNWWEFSDEVATLNPSLVKPVDYFDNYAWFIRERQ
jgi:hypothetical protein